MADSYSSIAHITATPPFQDRLTACAAQQGVEDPATWVWNHRWVLASMPGWGGKVDYWQDANPEEPADGWATDEAVISDADILAAVQPMVHGE